MSKNPYQPEAAEIANDLKQGYIGNASEKLRRDIESIELKGLDGMSRVERAQQEKLLISAVSEELTKLGFPKLSLTSDGQSITAYSDRNHDSKFDPSHEFGASTMAAIAGDLSTTPEQVQSSFKLGANESEQVDNYPAPTESPYASANFDQSKYQSYATEAHPTEAQMLQAVLNQAKSGNGYDYQRLHNVPGQHYQGNLSQMRHFGPANAYSVPVNTHLDIPAAIKPGQRINSRLDNGDPISGSLLYGRDGRLHFVGNTSTIINLQRQGQFRIPVSLDVPMY